MDKENSVAYVERALTAIDPKDVVCLKHKLQKQIYLTWTVSFTTTLKVTNGEDRIHSIRR